MGGERGWEKGSVVVVVGRVNYRVGWVLAGRGGRVEIPLSVPCHGRCWEVTHHFGPGAAIAWREAQRQAPIDRLSFFHGKRRASCEDKTSLEC